LDWIGLDSIVTATYNFTATLDFSLYRDILCLLHVMNLELLVVVQVNALPRDDESQQKKREELQKEVEQTKRALAQQVRTLAN
jgi:hypothetical protein